MRRWTVPGLSEFLCDYPLMALRPNGDGACLLRGTFRFIGRAPTGPPLEDAFELEIDVPGAFPGELPRVKEIGGRIPQQADFHVCSDGALCLGSPLRLLLKLSAVPTLTGFASSCLVPYLFAISQKLKNGAPLPFGELPHESPGLLLDYMDLFKLKNPDQVLQALRALGMKKRRANKMPCPCACGFRLGKCAFNQTIRQFRLIAPRARFRNEHSWIIRNLQALREHAKR